MAPLVAPRRPANGSQVRADRTRALVIDETIRCILEEGFAAASAKHITERAGVTWGVVQYHFGDRDGLLMAVVDKGFAELQAALRELPAGAENARDRTEFIVTAAWDAFSSPTSMAALEILIATRSMRDSGATQHLGDLATTFAKLGKHIGEGLNARHAAAIGNLIWTTLRGLVVAQLVVPDPLDTGRERRALIDMIAVYVESARA
ncbi:TetR/AcrR family transcriptional regulator [Mycobacterium sp.]|jgi:AcrR family transcriptional regulator|uniref:TetR/AcrR family transcriptional regulator n=1 Tax=Mycobacterium sp. TaxID=1785 RepID=UPI00334223DA|nr:transcriptional regulator [Mycobacterium sp.]